MEKMLKCKFPLERMHGATDAHNFGKVRQPLIITGVSGGHGAHSSTEWVNVKEVVKFEKALIGYIDSSL
jgi:di/tripeptidase